MKIVVAVVPIKCCLHGELAYGGILPYQPFWPGCSDARSRQPFRPWYRYPRYPFCCRRSHHAITPDPQIGPGSSLPICASDRLVAGFCALLIRPTRLIRSAMVLRPSTLLLSLHRTLRNRKYRMLFSPKRRRRPGPRDRPEKLLKPFSKQNSTIPRAVRELLSRLP